MDVSGIGKSKLHSRHYSQLAINLNGVRGACLETRRGSSFTSNYSFEHLSQVETVFWILVKPVYFEHESSGETQLLV